MLRRKPFPEFNNTFFDKTKHVYGNKKNKGDNPAIDWGAGQGISMEY